MQDGPVVGDCLELLLLVLAQLFEFVDTLTKTQHFLIRLQADTAPGNNHLSFPRYNVPYCFWIGSSIVGGDRGYCRCVAVRPTSHDGAIKVFQTPISMKCLTGDFARCSSGCRRRCCRRPGGIGSVAGC